MLIAILALLASFIFPILMYIYISNAHKDNPDYKKDCGSLLLNGALLVFPVFGFSLICNIVFRITHLGDRFPFVELLFSNFVLKALSEELMKYLCARKIINKNHNTVSILDYMAYTTIAAIGFELLEAFVYMFSTNVPQILIRGITNMHAAFGLVMGYIAARRYKDNKVFPVLIGIIAAILVHGAYDLCLASTLVDKWGGVSLFIAVICLIINIAFFFFSRKARSNPYYTQPLFGNNESINDSL